MYFLLLLILHTCSHILTYYLKTTKTVKWHFPAESHSEVMVPLKLQRRKTSKPISTCRILIGSITSMSQFNRSTQIHNFRVNKRTGLVLSQDRCSAKYGRLFAGEFLLYKLQTWPIRTGLTSQTIRNITNH